jgi:hypothetical protein
VVRPSCTSHLAAPGTRRGPASTHGASLCSGQRFTRHHPVSHPQSLSGASPRRWLHVPRLAPPSTGDYHCAPTICAQGIDLAANQCDNSSGLYCTTHCSNHRSVHRSRDMGPQTCTNHHAPAIEAALPLLGYGRAERTATCSALLACITSVGRDRRIPASRCRHTMKGRMLARLSAIPRNAAHASSVRSIRMNRAFSRARQPSDGHRGTRLVRRPYRDFLPALSTNDIGGGDAACD